MLPLSILSRLKIEVASRTRFWNVLRWPISDGPFWEPFSIKHIKRISKNASKIRCRKSIEYRCFMCLQRRRKMLTHVFAAVGARFYSSGHLENTCKIYPKSIKINCRRRHTQSREIYARMERKSKPKSFEHLKT